MEYAVLDPRHARKFQYSIVQASRWIESSLLDIYTEQVREQPAFFSLKLGKLQKL